MLVNLKSLLIKLRLAQPLKQSLIRIGFSSLQWSPYLSSELEDVIPPRELWVGRDDTLSHFLRWPYEYRAYLTLLCDMRQDASVLELACNHGRTMMTLLDYLQTPGRYEGLDILPKHIEFARNKIHKKYPIFNFTHADINNKLYNPSGQLNAEDYIFPYPENSFDIIYAASLFTHLLPPDSGNYFMQSRRVLRERGQCLFSFLVLDWYRGPGTSISPIYEFDHPLKSFEGVAVHNPSVPERVIAYNVSTIERMASDAHLKVKRIIPGFWSKTHKWSVNEQDLVLLEAV